MRLTPEQLDQFDRDGFLRFENLFSHEEVETLRAELERISRVDDPSIIRERTGALRTVYRSHEPDGATRSDAFRALACSPRFLEPAQQVLRTKSCTSFTASATSRPRSTERCGSGIRITDIGSTMACRRRTWQRSS